MVYFVRTRKRVYNSINSPIHFKKVRKNLKDNTQVIEAFIFKRGKERDSWIRTNKKKFQVI